jgi:hypothetical protein
MGWQVVGFREEGNWEGWLLAPELSGDALATELGAGRNMRPYVGVASVDGVSREESAIGHQ